MSSQDVEAYGLVDSVYDDKQDDILFQRAISYSAVIITMLAFIFSCIGISKGHQKNLEKTLYTFSFPYFNQVPRINDGMVVAIHRDSKVFTGAGVTLSRNVTFSSRMKPAEDIITLNYDHENTAEIDLLFAASRGNLHAFEVSYDDVVLSQDDFDLKDDNNNDIVPQGMHWMKNNIIAVVGNGRIFLYKADIKVVNRNKYDVKIEKVGNSFLFSEKGTEAYSHSDTISNEKLCLTWEEDDSLYTNVINFDYKTAIPTMSSLTKVMYGEVGAFHHISGLEGRGNRVNYLLARVGKKDGTAGRINVAVATVDREGKAISVYNWTQMPFERSYGFFEIDNLNERDSVMCYTESRSEGIVCTTISFTERGLTFGSHLQLHSGGAATYVNRMKLMIINRSAFGVLYSDAEVGGAVIWAMGGTNDAGDLVRHGPEFVVSQRGKDRRILAGYIGVSRIDENKVAIVELVNQEDGHYAFLHTAYLYPRPLGIAQRTVTGTTQVQFGGIWNVKKQLNGKKLRPGYLYYCNDRGNILLGGPHGYMNRNFGIQYATSREDESLMSLHNQVGIAVGEYDLLIRFA